MFADWLREQLRLSQMRQTDLARELSVRLKRVVDRATVNKMISGRRAIAADELLTIADILGVEVPTIAKGDKLINSAEESGAIEMHSFAESTSSIRRLVPVLGTYADVRGNQLIFTDDDYVEQTFSPPGLDNVRGIYAIYVHGFEMMPRYRPGEMVWIQPNKPVKSGDDILIKLKDARTRMTVGIIREFVAWQENELLVKAHRPNKEERYPEKDIAAVHPIVFCSRV